MDETQEKRQPQPLEGFIDSYLLISTMLKQAVEKLVEDGWSEEHARDIAVGMFLMSARNPTQGKKPE